jgi:hypothetical protein
MEARGKPFERGNKYGRGRPKGSRNKMTAEVRELLERYSLPLLRTAFGNALQRDAKFMQICMNLLMQALKNTPINIGKLPVHTAEDVSKASEIATQKVATGRITPAHGKAMAEILDYRRRVIETVDIERKVAVLEENHDQLETPPGESGSNVEEAPSGEAPAPVPELAGTRTP